MEVPAGWRRRTGVIYRPSGRQLGRYDGVGWANDGGDDAPWSWKDGRVLFAWAAGLLLVAVVVAAAVTFAG